MASHPYGRVSGLCGGQNRGMEGLLHPASPTDQPYKSSPGRGFGTILLDWPKFA